MAHLPPRGDRPGDPATAAAAAPSAPVPLAATGAGQRPLERGGAGTGPAAALAEPVDLCAGGRGRTHQQRGGAGGASRGAVAEGELRQPGSGRAGLRRTAVDGGGEPAAAGAERVCLSARRGAGGTRREGRALAAARGGPPESDTAPRRVGVGRRFRPASLGVASSSSLYPHEPLRRESGVISHDSSIPVVVHPGV